MKEAGHAFIKSQACEGWIAVGDDYDDGGFSGGNMDRPALRRLMADIQMGKIDRLSRSLADFARMVDVFDRHRVSFSAVTQQINSATSMGRLMFNVLLSFAQFEREVTGERIRDKIAASKAKGMWMGGPLPLGYDVRDRLLVINETEATLVRRIFDDFVTVRSATLMAKAYAAEGVVTKGGKPFWASMELKDWSSRSSLDTRQYTAQRRIGAVCGASRDAFIDHPPCRRADQRTSAHSTACR